MAFHSTMKKTFNLSPNYSKKARRKKNIKFIIIHYTGMQSTIESIQRLKNPNTKVSCHYLIDKKGVIIQMVPDKFIAWHAGKSKWGKEKNLNKNSIGIELQNKGHQHGYENFTTKQIKNLVILCNKLKKNYSIKKENFLGHSDIAPLRKVDPGEKFPWKYLSKYRIGKWFKIKTIIKKKKNQNKRKIFFKNIHKLGYRYFNIYRNSKSESKVITAFQRHYLPKKVSGKIDQKTLEISQFLVDQNN